MSLQKHHRKILELIKSNIREDFKCDSIYPWKLNNNTLTMAVEKIDGKDNVHVIVVGNNGEETVIDITNGGPRVASKNTDIIDISQINSVIQWLKTKA